MEGTSGATESELELAAADKLLTSGDVFAPTSIDQLAPSGQKARLEANLEVIALLRQLEKDGDRFATPAEQEVLARWSAWGALPDVFDESKDKFSEQRSTLRSLLTEQEWSAAARTTLNAHYTDPDYVTAMWSALRELGFEGGDVLEPGCGSGNFMGFAPPSARLVGIELDPISAGVARKLYPHSDVITGSFADTKIMANSFDAAIGNVPFADIVLHDPRHNPSGYSIHNHFILKSLALTKPGGVAAFITSRFTMDAGSPAARRAMHEQADLLGAVRLPTGAHRRAAGTDALTDILVFRKRLPGEAPRDDVWVTTMPRIVNGEKFRINTYFDINPEMILGDLTIGSGMYGSATVTVKANGSNASAALSAIARDARRSGLVHIPQSPRDFEHRDASQIVAAAHAAEEIWDGTITASQIDGSFSVYRDGIAHDFSIPKNQHVEARKLLALRDGVRELLDLESSSAEDTLELDTMRSELLASYKRYAAKYGPINRFKLVKTAHVDPDTGEQRLSRRRPPLMAKLRKDPFFPLVAALEVFDEENQTAQPAALLTKRVIAHREPARGTDNPEEALAICVDTIGRADIDQIARLLGTSSEDAREQLGTLVYNDPMNPKQIIPAEEYLSGNVRVKHQIAVTAAVENSSFKTNVDALTNVMPADLVPGEIEAKMGAGWIPADDVRAFLTDILDDETIEVEYAGQSIWEVKSQRRWSVAATKQWGTDRRPAPNIAKACLEQTPIKVVDKDSDGKTYPNPTETLAAQDKARQMQERFSEWAWEDPERAERLARIYNDRFNSIVLRDYSNAGRHLQLPGLSGDLELRDHQRTAVARMVSEQSVLLAHSVGAGKTLECVAGIHELKRLSLVQKPAVVVPNHMLDQFSREWIQAYPAARILAANSDDLKTQERRQFVAKVAAHDWDAIIMTRSAFQKLALSPEAEADYIAQELAEVEAMLIATKDSDSKLTVKRLEAQKQRAEEKMKKKLDQPRDLGISFEQAGIDYVVVDEQHDYKNLDTASKIAPINGAQRASDLHMKLEYLRSKHGNRVATFMTATPIANSITEAHVMLRYLRPDLLADAGVTHFDQWAATFAQAVTEIEMDPSGTSYRQKTRISKFQNVPELLRMWHTFADVKTAEDLKLPVPLITRRPDGERAPEIVLIPASDELQEYVQSLGERADRVRDKSVAPEVDNMLKISGDGRRAALSMRLVDPSSLDVGKLEAAADRIATIWEQSRDLEFIDPETKQSSPVRGAAQLAFCDQSTPSSERWNVYHEMKDLLVARGLPADSIRFIHEAKNDQEKAKLFAAVRSGHVSVMLGSTAKMGTGTNAQTRLIASHHLDAPWRPADVEQQIGRSIRQGNQNEEVQIVRYITEKSFDTYSWQTLERKDRFIKQLMRGTLDVREIEDIGENTPSYAEVKAVASGDPLILEKVAADTELQKLERLERAHYRSIASLRGQIDVNEQLIERNTRQITNVDEAIGYTVPTAGDAFAITIDGRRYTERADASAAFTMWASRHISPYVPREGSELPSVELGGQTVSARVFPRTLGSGQQVEFQIRNIPASRFLVGIEDLKGSGVGPIVRLENRVARLPELRTKLEDEIAAAHSQLGKIEQQLEQPFKHENELREVRSEVERIAAIMEEQAEPEAGAKTDEEPSPPPPVQTPHTSSPRPTADESRTGYDGWKRKNTTDRQGSTTSPPGDPESHSESRHDYERFDAEDGRHHGTWM